MMDDNKEQGNGGFTLVLGDHIDNRHGVIIKHIEHFHNGEDLMTTGNGQQTTVPEYVTTIEETDAEGELTDMKTDAGGHSLLDRIMKATYAVLHSNLLKHDYYYIALHKIIDEQNVLGTFAFTDLGKIIADSDPEWKCPKADNFRKEIIRGTYPDWKLVDRGYEVLCDYQKIAKLFLSVFNGKSQIQTQK